MAKNFSHEELPGTLFATEPKLVPILVQSGPPYVQKIGVSIAPSRMHIAQL